MFLEETYNNIFKTLHSVKIYPIGHTELKQWKIDTLNESKHCESTTTVSVVIFFVHMFNRELMSRRYKKFLSFDLENNGYSNRKVIWKVCNLIMANTHIRMLLFNKHQKILTKH
jgi:hypothetical protein